MPDAIATDVQSTFKRKVGPIPVWGWSIVFVGSLGAFLYVRQRRANGSQGAGSNTTVPISPTDAIGPYTNSGGSVPIDGGGSPATTPPVDNSAWELWLRPLLTALVANTAPRTTPVVTPNPPPTPPPSAGTPTGSPLPPPPGMLSGGGGSTPINIPTTQVPAGNHVINVAGGSIGIPQSALTGTFNIVHLGEGVHVNDLEGWTAWAPPSNISAFAGAPSGSYSANPNNAWQQWGSGEYIPGGSYVALMKTGTAQPGFQPRAA